MLDNLLRAGNSLSGKAGVDGAEKVVVNGSFGQGQEDHFVYGVRGALCRGIKFADGFDLIAKELNTHRAVCFG